MAVTRARHRCFIYTADVKGMETSALGYLLHQREPAVEGSPGRLNEDRIQKDLDRLINSGNGVIDLRMLSQIGDAGNGEYPIDSNESSLTHRISTRTLARQWRISSFSDMTSNRTIMPDDLSGGRDHDMTTLSTDTTNWPQNLTEEEPDSSPVLLHQFDRGPVAGIFFHSLFEHMDFTSAISESLTGLITDQLNRAGMNSDQWTQTLCLAVSDILDTPLDAEIPGLTLRQIPMNQRLNELEFLMPAAWPWPEHRHNPVTASTLFTLFESGSNPTVPEKYLHQLKRLQFPAIQGFLKGFMDLVFEYKKKWYIVDYKSNMLGQCYADYAFQSLEQAMSDHHYYLQYHLYVAALHRYLTHRIPGYDYDNHMGKVYYLFIRGMSKRRGPEFGVFQDRPPKSLVMQLSERFK